MDKKVRKIESLDLLLNCEKTLNLTHQGLIRNDIYIVKNVVSTDWIVEVLNYLTEVGRNTLPNYYPIKQNSPNSYRINDEDSRSYVKGKFQQFTFYPWNQDVFNFFHILREIYFAKNLLSNLRETKFLNIYPEEECIARLAFQHYPLGGGFLNKHTDPVDYHQITVPILQMSNFGKDFLKGGLYIVTENGMEIYLDELTEPGDVIFFNPRCPHGVKPVDPEEQFSWLSFRGRWMLLFAVNSLVGNKTIPDSNDLEDSI